MKKRILAIAVIVICLAVIGYGTLAFYTDEVVTHNVITSAGVDVEIVEKKADGSLFTNPTEKMMPGMDISKIVTVENNDAEAWIRVRVTVGGQMGDGTAMQDTQVDVFELDFNTEYWQYDVTTDYWYYKTPVAEDGVTEPLFTKVHFAEEMDNEYQGCKVTIDILAEAVQVANNPIPEGGNVTDIAGWPNT